MRSTNFSLVLNMDFQWCGYRLYTFMLSVKKMSFKTAFAIQILTAQKMKFSIKDFFSKCDQYRRKLLIRSHLMHSGLGLKEKSQKRTSKTGRRMFNFYLK